MTEREGGVAVRTRPTASTSAPSDWSSAQGAHRYQSDRAPVEGRPMLDPAVMRAALEHGQEGVLVMDAEGRIVYANRTIRRLVTASECAKSCDCHDACDLARAVVQRAVNPGAVRRMVRTLATARGEARFELGLVGGLDLEVRVGPYTDSTGAEGRIWNVRDVTDEREARARVRDREIEMVARLLAALDTRDEETGAHTRRLGAYAELVATELGWDGEAVALLRQAAPMHDLGKIGIPDQLLRKAGQLSHAEFEVLKDHTVIGGQLLSGSTVPALVLAKEIALAHHEHWDGTGYPYGLSGTDIPEAARIVAVCDVYDALVHERCYRPALAESEALRIMGEMNGRHFEPRIFEAFLRVLPAIRSVADATRDQRDRKAA